MGGLPITMAESTDFNHCIDICNLEESVFQGRKYVWWSRTIDGECIFKRLYRVMYNDKMMDVFPVLEVEHLVRSGSNDAHLLLNFSSPKENIFRSFRFLNFWLKEDSCMEVVRQNWQQKVEGNPFTVFQ